jgi:hypothetical protein
MNRRTFLKTSAGFLGTAGVAGLSGCSPSGYAEVDWLDIERVTVPVRGLPPAAEGLTIVLMSDFHLYPYTQLDLVRRAVTLANELQPDVVALVGDFVLESAESIFELGPVLGQLDATHGVFAALGNHDYWTDMRVVAQGLREAGIPLLRNRGLPIGAGTDWIYLAGMDDGWSGEPDLQRALEERPHMLPTVLLLHEPDFADAIAPTGQVALQLSGHSHGGQVRLPLMGAPVLPPYGEKYDMGLYRVGDMWLYTTRGIGVVGPPVRLNCRPEITQITLVGEGVV